ncbi:serine hydrolase [Nonomuraea jabiensis]|uniref:CubicO group peptidase (Beta-lactamase class C family) n=1 Tax=Nonomuraea jabiensis TaxID=882448 RepID=A0A7W9GEW8_9ACTN|nr:serine hydrolase [Nonomuraea jabiensis]MBB5782423.1 CubicO group peptidase (beta-lactamase class C family) [Nonomuraea jabiensis]
MLFSRLARRMDALVSAYTRLGRFSGAVLVARGDRRLFAKGYGHADHEHGAPNTPATAFRIGSQTKTFTAIAILQLQEQGRLRVTDPLARHLPGYPHGERITLHHLLTNTSGIPDYVTTDGFTRVMGTPRTRRQLIDGFKDRPLLFEPGARMSYSNSGWILLGEVIERLSGLTYGEYLRRNVLIPLAMQRSGLAGGAGTAVGYMSADGGLTRTPYLDNSNQDAAGALHSTVEDLHRWNRGLPRLLRRESLAELFGPHVESDGTGYGYGCWVSGDRVESAGGTIGFVSVSARYRRDDLFVTVLSNIENAAFSEIESALAAIARGEPYELPSRRLFVTVAPDLLDRYTGRYTMRYMGRTSTMDVTREGERLMVEVHGLVRTELRPMSETRFFARMKGEVELDFLANGEVALNWAGHEVTARPV